MTTHQLADALYKRTTGLLEDEHTTISVHELRDVAQRLRELESVRAAADVRRRADDVSTAARFESDRNKRMRAAQALADADVRLRTALTEYEAGRG